MLIDSLLIPKVVYLSLGYTRKKKQKSKNKTKQKQQKQLSLDYKIAWLERAFLLNTPKE